MRNREALPQLDGSLFLTDGGIETVLIFHEGLDLPAFAAFDLLKDEAGTEALRRYYEPYASLAAARGLGFVAESPTWRASQRWAAEIGYDADELAAFNRRAIALMEELRARHDGTPVVISGCVGPQDDGYNPAQILSAEAAEAYHSTQIETFASTAADMVTAITMTYAEEAIGVTRAALRAGLPVVISFTRRDRRPAPQRPAAGRGDRTGRRGDRRGARLLHDQLRPSDPLRGGARRASRSGSASAVCGPTPRPAATRSSTRRPSSTKAIRTISPLATRS